MGSQLLHALFDPLLFEQLLCLTDVIFGDNWVVSSTGQISSLEKQIESLAGTALVLCSERRTQWDDVAQLASDELDELRSAPIWDAQVDTFHQTLLPGLEVAGEYEWDLTTFEDLSTPTLLPVGSESGWLKETVEELHDTLPNSRLATFEGHGHAASIVAPDRFTDEVLSFISEVD